MPAVSRQWDITIGTGSHGLPCCPHVITGYRFIGSPDVKIDGLGASRAYGDMALHNCPHCTTSICLGGSPNTTINGLPAHRVGDMVTEMCGVGMTITGSSTVTAN